VSRSLDSAWRNGLRVLIVDDDILSRKLLSISLDRYLCTVFQASDAIEGLKLAISENPDLIVSDVLMPGMDGFHFLWNIRQDKDLSDVFFVFMTSTFHSANDKHLANLLGADGYFEKPIDSESLWKNVQILMDPEMDRKAILPPANFTTRDFLEVHSKNVSDKLLQKVGELEQEIASHKKTQDTLKKEHSALLKMQNAVNNSSISIIVTDAFGRVEYVNPKLIEVSGYSKNDLSGKTSSILDARGYSFYSDPEFWRCVMRDKNWSVECQSKKKNGDLFMEKLTVSPVRDDSQKVTNFVEIREDLSYSQNLNEQLFRTQKIDTIGRLAGGIAHDFNNILSAIGSYLGIVKMKDTCGGSLPDFNKMSALVGKAKELTESLLAIGRKDYSDKTIPININRVVDESVRLVRSILKKGVNLSVALSEDDLIVKANEGQLHQVIMNLVINANDAIEGTGEIRVETGENRSPICKNKDNDLEKYAVIRVADSGTGISEKTKSKMFKPFFSTKEDGSGL